MRQFKPSLVAIRNGNLAAELKEAIADVHPQPEIVIGDEGTVEVWFRNHAGSGLFHNVIEL